MKIYQIKLLTVIIALKNHFQTAQIIQKINHLITLTTEVDHQTKEIHVISHKTSIVDQIVEILNIEIIIRNQTQTDQIIRLIPIPIRTLGLDTIQLIDQKIHRTIDTEIIPTIETEAIRTIEISDIIINHEITQTKDLIYNNYQNRSFDNSQNRNSNYDNRQRNYSQSPNRNNTSYPDSQNKYRSNTPKHQRPINQVQTTEEINSDPLVLTTRKLLNYN